jgi:hypothetical protein
VRALLTLAIVLVVHAARAEIFEPGTETTGAVAAGASAVADAVKLGKQPDAKWKALFAFQDIATKWPAALHDCYLALAYLRVDEPQQARLVLDRAATRGGDRPKWCTGELEHQLAKALADYVQIVIDVTPRDALITVNGTLELRGLPSVWVLCGDGCREPRRVQLLAQASGFEHSEQNPVLVRPITHVEMRLIEKHEYEPPPQPQPPPDTTPVQQPPHVDQNPPPPVTPQPQPPVTERRGLPLRSLTLGLGIATAVGAAVGGYAAYYFHNEANNLYKTDADFAQAKSNYESAGIVAVSCAGVSALAFVASIFVGNSDAIRVQPTNSGVMFEVGGRW